MTNIEDIFVKQLQDIADEYDGYVKKSDNYDASDVLSEGDVSRLRTRAFAAIERVVGRNSDYYKQAQDSAMDTKNNTKYMILQQIIGSVNALLADIESNYLKSLTEIVHSNLFSDYLEMAQHLLDNGYKDAAVVIAGSTLEAHLKQLADKFGIGTSKTDGSPKKSDQINSELTKIQAYEKIDQKNITAWLGLRNEAAHGNYEKYDEQQANLLISCIRDFITRTPA